MKKLSLSLGLIVAFAFYTLFSSSKSVNLNLPDGQVSGTSSGQQAQQQAQAVTQQPTQTPRLFRSLSDDFGGDDDGAPLRRAISQSQTPAPAQQAPAPAPVQAPAPSQTGGTAGQYKNGSYTGSIADAYYGNVQVKAVIQNGKIANVQFLQHPSDRGTSIEINNYAMPILAQEAIQVQNSNVDIVSGATETSLAFRDSLASALAQAK